MPTAKLHFENGSEVDQPIPEGQTVPYRLQHIEDLDDAMTVRTFAYRKRQPEDGSEIHYDELPAKAESVRKHTA
jgi:hypothetical protein